MVNLQELSTSEKSAIEEFRVRFKNDVTPNLYNDDLLFYRFLKARNFDMTKAETMFRKHLIYRKAMQMDTIVQDLKPKEVFTKYMQGTNLGEDPEGNIVRYFAAGKIFVSDIVKCYKQYDFYKHLIWLVQKDLARIRESNQKTGKHGGKIVFIFDADQLELSNVLYPSTPKYLLYIAEKYQNNFPETLKALYVINAPAFCAIAIRIVKKVLVAEVFQKFHIFGRNGWKDELLKAMDPDILPAFLGGNRTDPDGNPLCKTFICHSGKVPPKYYLPKQDREFQNKSQVKMISLLPKNTHEVIVEVTKCGSIIQWEYEVPKKDIGFGLFFKDSEENIQEILPIMRFETCNGTESDSYKCQYPGTYVIMFDNSYSWLNVKELSYCITVILPDE